MLRRWFPWWFEEDGDPGDNSVSAQSGPHTSDSRQIHPHFPNRFENNERRNRPAVSSNTGREPQSPNSQPREVCGDQNSEEEPLLTHPSEAPDTVITVDKEQSSDADSDGPKNEGQSSLLPLQPRKVYEKVQNNNTVKEGNPPTQTYPIDTVVIVENKGQSPDVHRNGDSDDKESEGQSSSLSSRQRKVFDDKNSESESQPLLTASGYPSTAHDTVITVNEEESVHRNDDSDDPRSEGQSSLLPRESESQPQLHRVDSPHSSEAPDTVITVESDEEHSQSSPLSSRPKEVSSDSSMFSDSSDSDSDEEHPPNPQRQDASGGGNSSNDEGQQGCGVMSCFSRLSKCRSDGPNSEEHPPNSQRQDASGGGNRSNDEGQQGCGVSGDFSRLSKCRSDGPKSEGHSAILPYSDDLKERFSDFLHASGGIKSGVCDTARFLKYKFLNFGHSTDVWNALNGIRDVSPTKPISRDDLERLHDEKSRTVYFLFHLLETDHQGDMKSKIPSLLSLLQLDAHCVLRVLNSDSVDVNFSDSQQTDTENSKRIPSTTQTLGTIDKLESGIRLFFSTFLFVCRDDVIKRKIWSLLQPPGDLYDLYERLKSFLRTLYYVSHGSDLQKLIQYVQRNLMYHAVHVVNALNGMCDVSSTSPVSRGLLERLHDKKSRTVYFLVHLLETDHQGDMKSKIQSLLSLLQLKAADFLSSDRNKHRSSSPQSHDDELEIQLRSLFLKWLVDIYAGDDLRNKIRVLLQIPEGTKDLREKQSFLCTLHLLADFPRDLKSTVRRLLQDESPYNPSVLNAEDEMCGVSKSRTVYFLFHLLETDHQGDMKSKIPSLLSLLHLEAGVVLDVLNSDRNKHRNSEQIEKEESEKLSASPHTHGIVDELESELWSLFLALLLTGYARFDLERKIQVLLQIPYTIYDLKKNPHSFLCTLHLSTNLPGDLKATVRRLLRDDSRTVLNAEDWMCDVSNISKRTGILERLHDEKSKTVYFLFQLLQTNLQGDMKSKIQSLLSQLQLEANRVFCVLTKPSVDVNFSNAKQTDTEESMEQSCSSQQSDFLDKLEGTIWSLFLPLLSRGFVSNDLKSKIRHLLQLRDVSDNTDKRLENFLNALCESSEVSLQMTKTTRSLLRHLQYLHPYDVLTALKDMCDVSSSTQPTWLLEALPVEESRTVYFLYQLLETDLQGDMKSTIQSLLSQLQLEANIVFCDLESEEQSRSSQQSDLDKLEGTIRSLLSQLLHYVSNELKSKIRPLLQLRDVSDNTDKRLENFLNALCKSSDVPDQLKKTTHALLSHLKYVHPFDVLSALNGMCDVPPSSQSALLLQALPVMESRTLYFLYQLLESNSEDDLKRKIQSLLQQLQLKVDCILKVLHMGNTDDSDKGEEKLDRNAKSFEKTDKPPSSPQDIDTLERKIRRIFLTVMTGDDSTDDVKHKAYFLLTLPNVSGNSEERLKQNLVMALLQSRVSKTLQETIIRVLLVCDIGNAPSRESSIESKTVYFLCQLLETDVKQEQQDFKGVLNSKIQVHCEMFNLQPTELLKVLNQINIDESKELRGGDDSDESEELCGISSCFSCKTCRNAKKTETVESKILSLFLQLLSGDTTPGDVRKKIRDLLLFSDSCHTKCKYALQVEWVSPFSVFTVVLGILSILLFLADIGTDVKLAAEYFLDSHWIYGSITTALVVVPSLVACCVNLYWYYGDYKLEVEDSEQVLLREKTPTRIWFLRIGGSVLQCGPAVRTVEYLIHGVTQVRSSWDKKGEDVKLRPKLRLNLTECFLESAPQLAFQLYVVMTTKQEYSVTETPWLIGAMLISWASLALNVVLYIRGFREIHSRQKGTSLYRKQMNNWNTVVCFLWKLCETGCRVLCLAMFASTFGPWVFVFIAFHVVVVTIWLCIAESKLCTVRIAKTKVAFNIIFGYMMLFCYVKDPEGWDKSPVNKTPANEEQQPIRLDPDKTHEDKTPANEDERPRFTTRFHYLVFYALFYFENFLMLGLWFQYTHDQGTWYHTGGLIAVVVLFVLHVIFQLLYYTKCCHPSETIHYCHLRYGPRDEDTRRWDRYLVCRSLCCINDAKGTIAAFKEKYACNCCSRGHGLDLDALSYITRDAHGPTESDELELLQHDTTRL